MIHKLIESGAYKLAQGYFHDYRNNVRGQFNHSLYILLKYYCDDEHSSILKMKLKEQSEWSDELEAKFHDK